MPAARKPYTEGEYLKLEAYVFENPDQRIGGPKFWNRLLAVCTAHVPGNNADHVIQDCPWARVHSAASWQSHWSGNGMLQQRMHRAQQKGAQEKQDSDEEDSTPAPAPAPIRPRPPVAGPSSPAPLQDTRLGKRKVREIEAMDYLPLCKRPRNQDTHTSSKPPVRSNNERGRTDLAVSRPLSHLLARPIARISTSPAQTVPHGLSPSFSPSKCSTPVPLHRVLPPIPTSTLQSPVIPILPPIVIGQSPAKSTNDQSEPRSWTCRQPITSRIHPQTCNRAEFIDIDLSLEFSGSEDEGQSEQGEREEKDPVISGSGRNESRSANRDEDSDKTEPDTDTNQDGSQMDDTSQLTDSEDWMETQDYAMPWRKCLPAIPSPPYVEHSTGLPQRRNKDQVLVPTSQSTNSQSTGNSKARPLWKVDSGTRSVDSPSPQKEQETDSDTSCVPDSQDDISLLGPSSRLDRILGSSLPSSVLEWGLPHPNRQPRLEDEPLSQPSQLTDPDFVPGNASFDEYTDPLEFMIGVGSQQGAPLELKDEVDQLGQVVHYEGAGYAFRDRERLQRSESGASTGTDTTTLIGDYFEGKEEEIKKETEVLQESQLTQTDASQCQPSQPLSSESPNLQPFTTPALIRSRSPKSIPMKLQHPRPAVKSLSSVRDERKNRLVIAVLDLIAHWLQVKDVKLVHDIWDSLPLHEQTFGRVLRFCLQCDLTTVRTTSTGSSDDEGGGGERPIRFVRLRQRYMIAPDPKRRFPYPQGGDPGHEWIRVICRMLGAMYGFKAQYVHKLWTETGGDIHEVERQLEGRKTGWLDLSELGLGDVPRPWV